jgi:hypothetical protein
MVICQLDEGTDGGTDSDERDMMYCTPCSVWLVPDKQPRILGLHSVLTFRATHTNTTLQCNGGRTKIEHLQMRLKYAKKRQALKKRKETKQITEAVTKISTVQKCNCLNFLFALQSTMSFLIAASQNV